MKFITITNLETGEVKDVSKRGDIFAQAEAWVQEALDMGFDLPLIKAVTSGKKKFTRYLEPDGHGNLIICEN